MTPQLIFAVLTYAFVTSITPGPNNTMLLASGVNFGVTRTLPHLMGVSWGFAFMAVIMGLGMGQIFDRWPVLLVMLKWLGVVYIVYLAWRIWQSSAPQSDGAAHAKRSKPLGFWAAVAFQWVNIKAVFMAISVMALYAGDQPSWQMVMTIALLFTLVNMACCGSWVLFGAAVRRWLQNPVVLRAFNAVMAIGLLMSLYPIIQT